MEIKFGLLKLLDDFLGYKFFINMYYKMEV